MATSAIPPSSSPLGIETWLRSVGIWWDPTLIRIQGGCSNCSGPALGVFAEKDIQENQLLCVIPRSAILSPRTSQLATILEAEKLGGGLALTVAVMYEASLRAASRWAGYFESLPKREYLPMFWTDEELSLLEGTALEGCAEEDRRDTEEDYQTHVVPLLTRHPEAFPHPELCSLNHFRIAASWVASRSFHVDSWHGDAMLPLADIFNHKASLVLLDDAWKVAEEMKTEQQGKGSSSRRSRRGVRQKGSGDGSAAAATGSDDVEHSGSEDAEVPGESAPGSEGEQYDHESAGEDEGPEAEEVEEEDSDDASDDPHHGFAVGGMPLTAAAAAAGGIVHKAASSWVRDGVNLRLEIGICSLGPSDNTDLAAAAAAAANADADQRSDHHDHDHDCGDHCDHKHKRQRTDHPHPHPQHHQHQEQEQQQFPDKRLEIIAASSVAAGAEVHNTYGELSNAELVHKYGFCLPQNPFDEVQLGPSWEWLLLKHGKLDEQKQFTQHIQWLQQHSDVLPQLQQNAEGEEAGEFEQSAEPPAVMPGGRLPLPTAAVVRLLGAGPAQLKKWNSLEDMLNDILQPSAAAGEPAAEAALSEHFKDVLITDHDVSWWGCEGLEVLAAGIAQRLERYPVAEVSKSSRDKQQQQQQQSEKGSVVSSEALQHLSIETDEKSLRETRQQQQQHGGTSEHAAAVSAALQLRICEQRILKQALDAIERVLSTV